ncbi:MAG: hypothetical protein H0V82_03270 [Candidatus Protochlamydia sp.]|nr:hypothetical protein [Candidatus Protochlamydia sp.]
MNVLSLIKNACFNLYNSSFSYQNKETNYQPRAIPEPIIRRMNFCDSKHQPGKLFCEFNVSVQSRNTHFPSPLNSINPRIPSQTIQVEGQTSLLIQTLHNQISQLERENHSTLDSIAVKPSHYTLPNSISPLTTLSSKENIQKYLELTKLNTKLQKVSDFSNEEMMEVLDLVSEACVHLEDRLKGLREKSPYIEEDDLLIENIEHSEILETTVKALRQLEANFQAMQKAHLTASQVIPNKQADTINNLLEKIDQLNYEKGFLQECRENLPFNQAYDIQELHLLTKSFSSERTELNQKIDFSRQKLNKAKQFSNEMTNHLLDYAELLKINLQSIRRLCPNAASSKLVITPLLDIASHKMTLTTNQAKIEKTQEEGINQDEFRFAANEVALALKQLMEIG